MDDKIPADTAASQNPQSEPQSEPMNDERAARPQEPSPQSSLFAILSDFTKGFLIFLVIVLLIVAGSYAYQYWLQPFELSDDESTLYKYNGNAENVTIPFGVTGIASGAFKDKKLRTVVIPASVKRIGSGAFEGCHNLGNVFTVGSSLTPDPDSPGLKIEDGAFRGCPCEDKIKKLFPNYR